jgi:hypothetical protein
MTDQEQRDVVRRLATVLAGGAGKGRAGEHLLRQHLAELPPDMLVTDVRVNGKVVEFGLVLPDGRRLPIDSKWTALAEVEALEAATDPVERDACARAVERATAIRVKEVAQYLDPAITAPIAVAAVPDAVYASLKRVHADAYGKGVAIVPTPARCRSCCSSTAGTPLRRSGRSRPASARSPPCSTCWSRSWRTVSRRRP